MYNSLTMQLLSANKQPLLSYKILKYAIQNSPNKDIICQYLESAWKWIKMGINMPMFGPVVLEIACDIFINKNSFPIETGSLNAED